MTIEREKERHIPLHRRMVVMAVSALLPLSAAASPQDKSSPVRPFENPGTWVHDDEVPAAARQEKGSVSFKVNVAPSGEVSDCTIIKSSVSPLLSDAFCEMLKRHGRFSPARDASGNAISATYVMPEFHYWP